MWVAELKFRVIADTDYNSAEAALRHYLEALIFQGQILGREFPTHLAEDCFYSRVILPTLEALETEHHSVRGKNALLALNDAGLAYPTFTVLGQDLMSNHSDPCSAPDQYILYSRFGIMNSPLYCHTHFAPVPLYQIPATCPNTGDHEALIRWQLQYQALDEIQMQQQRVLPFAAERSLQQPHSVLNVQGRRLAKQLERMLAKPVYYTLYSGSSPHCASEAHKRCPLCGHEWALASQLHDRFDFQCDRCRLLGNIAWDCQ